MPRSLSRTGARFKPSGRGDIAAAQGHRKQQQHRQPAELLETVLPQVPESERNQSEPFDTGEERDLLAGLLRRQLLALEPGG
jgi:hypothetical protein